MRSRTKQRGRAAGPPGLWGTLWRLTLVGALLFAAAAAAGYATVAHLVKTPETQAPDLLAMELADAIREASADGFSARVAGSEPSSVLQSGQVAAQRPLPGTWVKEGATIQLVLAE